MDKYIVSHDGEEVEVYADNLSFGAAGLVFQRNKENIAQFMKWDYWIKFDKEKREENESPTCISPFPKELLELFKKYHGLN